MNNIHDAQVSIILQLLKERLPNLLAVYGFGSRIHGCIHANSDWDISILVTTYVDPVQLWSIAYDLEQKLSAPVDLLDFRNISTVMQYQILTTGQRWWALDAQVDIYEAMIMSEKMDLDQARAGILEKIKISGTVYG